MKKQSLRVKLALSNILPILFLIPFLSLYFFYSLENFFSQKLLDQLAVQARLFADRVEEQPLLTQDSRTAQAFLAEAASLTEARVILLSKNSIILASTRREDVNRVGSPYADPAVARALQGERVQGIGPGFATEVAYIVLPLQQNGVTIGALRLSYEIADLRAEFVQLQWLVLGGIGLAAIIGLGLGLGLAGTIAGPLHQLTKGAQNIAAGHYQTRVTAHTHDEIGILAHSFNQMAAQLEEAELGRERQLSAITHELARPLAGLHVAVETLRDSADADTEIRETLFEGMEEELGRLERQLSTLRELRKRGFRPIHLTCAPVSVERVIRASIASFEPVAAQTELSLTADVPAHLPQVWADEDRLIQVLTNLLDNAFKFTPRNGQVIVQAGENAGAVWVRVTDTGVGITPAELPYIFQQFYRGDESRAPEKHGMGLGLTICREIVTAHGGQIKAESQVGQGTRFTFTLPKA